MIRCATLRGRLCFCGLTKLSRRQPCPGDTEHGSRCHPFFAYARTVVRTGRGSGRSMPVATRSLLARRREPGEGQEVRLRQSTEAECAPKNRSTARHLGGGRGRAVACAHWLPQGGGKTSADGLPMRLRAARSPPRKSAGAARRPSRGASFFEARAVRERSKVPGKKSGSTNSRNSKQK